MHNILLETASCAESGRQHGWLQSMQHQSAPFELLVVGFCSTVAGQCEGQAPVHLQLPCYTFPVSYLSIGHFLCLWA